MSSETIHPPPWLEVAEKELGVSEIKGPKDNPRIIEYLKTVKLPAGVVRHDELFWCKAFVTFCLLNSGFDVNDSPLARAMLHWGRVITKPEFGCVVIMRRGESWQGHTFFYCGSPKPGTISGLGGNQGNRVSIEHFPINQILGYRMPSDH